MYSENSTRYEDRASKSFTKKRSATEVGGRKSNVWVQWYKELAIWVILWVFNLLNLQKVGLGQADLVYNIDEVKLN